MQRAITDDQILGLLPRFQRAEPAAVEALYDLYSDRLYRYLLARCGNVDTAAELTAEVFVRMIQHSDGYRLNQQRPAASFSAWLYKIAANLLADHYRGHRAPTVPLAEGLSQTSDGSDPHRWVEAQETAVMVAQALNQLSEDQRLVLVGKFAEDMSNAEVAAWLGKSEGAVKSLQHRALRTLGRVLAPGRAGEKR